MAPKRKHRSKEPPLASPPVGQPATDDDLIEQDKEQEEELSNALEAQEAGPSNAPKSLIQKPSNAPKSLIQKPSNAPKSLIQKPSNAPKTSAAVKRGVSRSEGFEPDTKIKKQKKIADGSGRGSHAKEKSQLQTPSPKSSAAEKHKSEIRLWRGKDEVALRNGLALFQSQNRDFDGKISDKFVDAFHEFIKDSLQRSVSKSQLFTKLKRLKKKCRVIAKKIEDGEQVSSEDRKLFKLGKKVWGNEPGKKAKSSGGEQMEEVVPDSEDDDDLSQYPYFQMGCSFLPECFKIDSEKRMGLVPLAEKKEMEKAWSLYFKKEEALKVKRLGLLRRQSMIMLRPIGDSDRE